MTAPTIETPRLILRPPKHEDFDAWAGMHAEDDTMRFIGGTCPRDAAWRVMATMAGSWALQGYGMFSVIERQTGQWIGRLGPWRPGGEDGGWPGDEVGWGLIRAAQGRGLAHEGAAAAIAWAFDNLGWDHVVHCIAKQNAPSIALAERLGSTRERENVPLPPPFNASIVDIYGQSRAAWRAR